MANAMKVLYVARSSLGFYGFGSTPEQAKHEFIKARGPVKTMRMTKVTHPANCNPYIDGDTNSIRFPDGEDGRGTTYEDLRFINGLWLRA